jgi:hypothetical protein
VSEQRGRGKDDPGTVVDLDVEELHGDAALPLPDEKNERLARRGALAKDATTALVPRGNGALFGSASFFARAAEELVLSTELGLELAGVAYSRVRGGRTVLVGLKREMTGQPGRVPIDPSWGGVLWHTHPGLRASLAAFSQEDLHVAKQSNKPLLVIGFSGLSPDVLSTLAMPFGLRAMVVAAGVKGILSLEKSGRLRRRLLSMGVAARVCWPSGVIQPVLRTNPQPLRAAFDDVAFALDSGVGAVERTGQRIVKAAVKLAIGKSDGGPD